MPARETYWRNLKTTHIVFAVSSAALAASTFWMMADDYSSEWRGHQQTMDTLEALKLRADEGKLTSGSYRIDLDTLNRRIEDAKQTLTDSRQELGGLRAEVAGVTFEFQKIERQVRTRRAERDKLRADYGLAVRDVLPKETLAKRYNWFAAEQAVVDKLEEELQERQATLDAAQSKLDNTLAQLTAAESEKNNLEFQVNQTRNAINKLEPKKGSFSAAKRFALDLPILDGFSQVHRIRQDWLPDLMIKNGMVKTARFDRCRTCHLGIDRVETGDVPAFPLGKVDSDEPKDWVAANKYPHPYATHPRPELYLTAASPHPVQEFGCTICHDGQGSATDFNNAQHGPNNPHQEELWAEEYGHHYNHHWEYPMLPQRFREASCLKCHHNVTELGINPKFGASAPKLFRGFQLIQKYGCFGCHEIPGFEAEESIGPDLRLEPNYNPAALQLLYRLTTQPENAVGGDRQQAIDEVRRLAERVAAEPVDTIPARRRLRALIEADGQSPNPRFSTAVHRTADLFKDVDSPGRYRKVGPSLRYIQAKLTPQWVEYWTEEPKRFRPSTRMPQFFGNTNQQDGHAAALMPVELTAIAEYLFGKSQPYKLRSPETTYTPDAKRGKTLFAQKGCLACHSHKDFPEISADFGPDLSKIRAKLKLDPKQNPDDPDFSAWLYNWLLNPKRYHPRTKMPNLFLEQRTVGDETVDPAADIAAFLLQGKPAKHERYTPQPYLGVEVEDAAKGGHGVRVTRLMPFSPASRAKEKTGNAEPIRFGDMIVSYGGKAVNSPEQLQKLVDDTRPGNKVPVDVSRNGQSIKVTVIVDEPLDDMVRLFLTKTIGIRPAEVFLQSRQYPGDRKTIKGDEIELTSPQGVGTGKIDDQQWRRMKLNYVGRRTITRYGCFGCHDIPGFEGARPIGTTLQDWGRKDTSKLALEHIEEYLGHHGEPDESSTHDRVVQALKDAAAGGVETRHFNNSAEEEERELAAAAMYENLVHHRRPGFLWQKLRQPRSYDYHKTETKGYDERLRMPRFPFSEADIEAISTFVLGLIAEPPAERYIYQPHGADLARIQGEFLLEKYNCLGCHMVELPQFAYALDMLDQEHPYRDLVGWTADEIAEWFVDNRAALLADTLSTDDYPADVQLMQRLGAPLEEIIQLTNDSDVTDSDKNGLQRLRRSVRAWLGERPQYMLTKPLDRVQGEFPAGIEQLLRLKPPVDGTIVQAGDEEKPPIVRFHGLLMTPPDPEEDPEFQFYGYQLWETLEVGGRILRPGSSMPIGILQAKAEFMKPARGGRFAEWLVENLQADRRNKASGDRGMAWQMAPPPLYLEGIKVQTPWLYKFLKNPQRIRHETVLRMPRFNLDDAEARTLANYFAAVDGVPYPYQDIPQREPFFNEQKTAELRTEGLLSDASEGSRSANQEGAKEDYVDRMDYLGDSWKLLNARICIGCHDVGGKPFKAPDPKKVTHGPDLNRVHERLRPEWMRLWLSKPAWITPYTKMIPPKADPTLFGGEQNAPVQSQALRDALLNYNYLMQRDGAIFYDNITGTVKPPAAAESAPPPTNNGNQTNPGAQIDEETESDHALVRLCGHGADCSRLWRRRQRPVERRAEAE